MAKPVRPRDRCGVSNAWKNGSSASNEAFVSLMAGYYRKGMTNPKSKNPSTAKNELPSGRRDGSNAKPRPRPARSRLRYSAAEVHEIFRRFSVQRPEPKG